jgi:nucleoid-associated protein YgaU
MDDTGQRVVDVTVPDADAADLAARAATGRLGWAAFTLSVAVEVPAQLRGRSAPRLPALGASQRIAGALVAAVAVLVVSSPAPMPAPTDAHGHLAISTDLDQPSTGHGVPDRDTGSPTTLSTPDRYTVVAAARATPNLHPTYRVQRQDTLWAIAERCLGAGERFPEIAALNYGLTQPDGRALTNSHWIYPGWLLRLPPDARTDIRSGREDPARRHNNDSEYTVQPGDTLWDIAAAQVGSPDRYEDIAGLNTGQAQPNGKRLRDPDHIEPGWHLQLPNAKHANTARPEHPISRPPGVATSPGPLAAPTPRNRPAEPESRPRDGGSADPGGTAPTSDTKELQDGDQAPDSVPAKVGLGLAGITSAALLAVLARRRVLQQRARPRGRRIALPDPETRAIETRLRAADDRDTLRQLRSALLLLAAGCRPAGRDLPAMSAVRITGTDVELNFLHQDAESVEPFTVVNATRWTANLNDPRIVEGEPADPDVPFPYPALLTVDATEDSTLLIDLEAAGTVTAIGSTDVVTPVLNAWAVELAIAPVWDTVGVTLVGSGWPLAAVDAARVRLLDTGATAARRAEIRTRDVTAILDATQVETLRQARSRGVASDVWDPEIVLLHSGDVRSPLEALVRAAGPGLAVVTAAPPSAAVESGWTLVAASPQTWRLEPVGIDVRPPRFEDAHLLAVTAALKTANDEVGIEAPPAGPAEHELANGHIVSTRDIRPPSAGLDDESHDEGRQPAPEVLVLGPVEVRFANGEDVASGRRRKLTELAAFIALHPGADNHGIDDAIWPTRRVSTSTRNSATSRLRRWLGTDPDGEPWLPLVPDRGQYQFRPGVRCDWHDFQALTRRGLCQRSRVP